MFEGEIQGFTDAVDSVQSTFFPQVTTPFEFHAGHMNKGKARWRSETRERRDQVLRSTYSSIGNQTYPGVVLFGVNVHETAPEPAGPDALHLAFEEVCGRFNQFLVRLARGGRAQKGLVVVDQSGRDTRYRELADTFRRVGVRLGFLGNIVDIPYFTHSHHTRMMQVADFVAYAIFQDYENQFPDFLNLILDRFDWPERNLGRHPVGLCHLTRNLTAANCTCNATNGHL